MLLLIALGLEWDEYPSQLLWFTTGCIRLLLPLSWLKLGHLAVNLPLWHRQTIASAFST